MVSRVKLTLMMALPLFAGCAENYGLRMQAHGGLLDESSSVPELASQHYSKIMIIPPSGTARGQFDNEIAEFEREFIKHNITVISGAITGRVVIENQDNEKEKKLATGEQLSDIERALIMAKKTGVDVLLQIGHWGWSGDRPSRYFVLMQTRPNMAGQKLEYREVSLNDYQSWSGKKRMFSSPVLSFVGKLVDVSSGKVMISFKLTAAANWDLPEDYVAEISDQGWVTKQNFVYSNAAWVQQAKERIVHRVIGTVAEKIGGR